MAVKRLEIARQWLLAVMRDPDRMLIRTEELEEPPLEWAIISDACPTGYGAVLAKVVPGAQNLQPVDAYEAKFTEAEAKLLEVKWGEASSQGPLEALGLWRAMKTWATRIQGKGVLARSDSAVTLATTEKGASGSMTMNFLGGELTILAEKLGLPTLKTQHLAGKLNVEADWLSRPGERGKEVPAALRQIRIRKLGPISHNDFEIAPPGRSNVWKDSPHSGSVFRCL